MTAQELSHEMGHQMRRDMGRIDGDLGELFERSPVDVARTAAAAEISFVLGLIAFATAPFALTYGLCVMATGLGIVISVVGLAQASRSGVAGTTLAASGLVLSLGALALVGLRFAGVDTTFGDSMLPDLRATLEALTGLVPTPQ